MRSNVDYIANLARKERNKNKREYNKDPKYCKQCGKKIPYEKRINTFCDRSCSIIHSNTGQIRSKKVLHKCEYCGELTKNPKYCSCECSSLHVKHQAKQRTKKNPRNNSSHLKSILIERRGYKCQVCKRKTWNKKPISLEIHHKDGDSNNMVWKNLQLICPNCHAQTDTYKGKNKGNGRHYRKERYAVNKSY